MNLSTENIRLSYGAQEILKGVSINGNTGEFIGIIGPNGSGKIHAFKVYLPHFKASCRTGFSGRRRTFRYQYPEFSKKKVAVVAQHNYYNFDFSVMEVVLMGRAPHKK